MLVEPMVVCCVCTRSSCLLPTRDHCIVLSCKKIYVSNYDELSKMENPSGCSFSVEEELLDIIKLRQLMMMTMVSASSPSFTSIH